VHNKTFLYLKILIN